MASARVRSRTLERRLAVAGLVLAAAAPGCAGVRTELRFADPDLVRVETETPDNHHIILDSPPTQPLPQAGEIPVGKQLVTVIRSSDRQLRFCCDLVDAPRNGPPGTLIIDHPPGDVFVAAPAPGDPIKLRVPLVLRSVGRTTISTEAWLWTPQDNVQVVAKGEAPTLVGVILFFSSVAFLTPGGIIVQEPGLKAPGGVLLGIGCVDALVGAILMLEESFPAAIWPKPASLNLGH